MLSVLFTALAGAGVSVCSWQWYFKCSERTTLYSNYSSGVLGKNSCKNLEKVLYTDTSTDTSFSGKLQTSFRSGRCLSDL